MTDREPFRRAAERALALCSSRLSTAPVALPYMLSGCEFYLGEPRQIVFTASAAGADLQALLHTLRSRFLPNAVTMLVDSPETRRKLAAWVPAIESMHPLNGRPAVYVCRNYTCQLPVSEAARFSELLQ